MNDKKQTQKSRWAERADFRSKNRKWLNYSSKIARRIIALIEDDEDKSRKQLAESLDVSQQYISKLLKGQQNLSLETIGKLSDALQFELISFPEYKYSKVIEVDLSEVVIEAAEATDSITTNSGETSSALNPDELLLYILSNSQSGRQSYHNVFTESNVKWKNRQSATA